MDSQRPDDDRGGSRHPRWPTSKGVVRVVPPARAGGLLSDVTSTMAIPQSRVTHDAGVTERLAAAHTVATEHLP